MYFSLLLIQITDEAQCYGSTPDKVITRTLKGRMD
jgi:hypothetical protein